MKEKDSQKLLKPKEKDSQTVVSDRMDSAGMNIKHIISTHTIQLEKACYTSKFQSNPKNNPKHQCRALK